MNEAHLTDEQLDRLRAGLDEQAAWAIHLSACAHCQARFQAWRGLRPAPGAVLAGELAGRRAAALTQAKPGTGHPRWYYPALAATLAAVSLGLWMVLSPAPTTVTVADRGSVETPPPDVYADLDFYLWLSKQSPEEQGEANSS
jgi:hypothetical protein